MAEALTPCTMEGYEQYLSEGFIPPTEIRDFGSVVPDFAKVRKNEGKAKFPQCRLCKYDDVCEGQWKEYPEKFGSEEFVPVKGEKDDTGGV